MSATNVGFTYGNGAYNGTWDMVLSVQRRLYLPFMASLAQAFVLPMFLLFFSYAKGSLTFKSFRDFLYICIVLVAALLCMLYMNYKRDTYYDWPNFSDWVDGHLLCSAPKPNCFDRKHGGTLATILGSAFFVVLFGYT